MLRRLSPVLAASAVLLALAACSHRGADPFLKLSVDDVAAMLGRPDVVIIDANTPQVFQRNHLPGARLWRSAPPVELLPTAKDTRLVFYCASPS